MNADARDVQLTDAEGEELHGHVVDCDTANLIWAVKRMIAARTTAAPAPTDAREALAASFDQRADTERAIWQRSIHPERGEAQEREAVWRVAARDVRATAAPAPTDAREALAELAERIGRAADSLTTLAASSVSLERVRLEGKAEGMRLAESYTDDATRLAAVLSPTATDAGQRDTQERADWGPYAVCRCTIEERTQQGTLAGHYAAVHGRVFHA